MINPPSAHSPTSSTNKLIPSNKGGISLRWTGGGNSIPHVWRLAKKIKKIKNKQVLQLPSNITRPKKCDRGGEIFQWNCLRMAVSAGRSTFMCIKALSLTSRTSLPSHVNTPVIYLCSSASAFYWSLHFRNLCVRAWACSFWRGFPFSTKKNECQGSLTVRGRASDEHCEWTFYSGSFCGVNKRELNVLFGSFQPGSPLSCLWSELAGEKKKRRSCQRSCPWASKRRGSCLHCTPSLTFPPNAQVKFWMK